MLYVGSTQAIANEIPQTGLQEMAKLPAASVGPLQPAFFEDLVLGKFLEHDFRVVPQCGKGRDQENLQW